MPAITAAVSASLSVAAAGTKKVALTATVAPSLSIAAKNIYPLTASVSGSLSIYAPGTWQAPAVNIQTLPQAPAVAQATTDLYNALGPIPNFGAGDAVAGYPLLSFLDGLGQILQRLNDLALDDLSTGDPGWSVIFDPTRCPTYVLPWLYQCVGGRFSGAEATDALQRSAILGKAAWKRGTVGALQAAAAPFLQPGQQVQIFERDTSPYHLTVVVSTAFGNSSYVAVDSAYASYTAMSAAFATYAAADASFPENGISAALLAAKAAGLMMTITFTAGSTYAAIDAAFGTYNAMSAAFANYAAANAWT